MPGRRGLRTCRRHGLGVQALNDSKFQLLDKEAAAISELEGHRTST